MEETAAQRQIETSAVTVDNLDETLKSMPAEWTNKPKHIPIEVILALRKRNLSHRQIGQILKCSKRNVQHRLNSIITEADLIPEFKKHRADILSMHQKRILNSISKKAIEKSSLKDKTIAFGVLFDKEKIETGKMPGDKVSIRIINFAGAANGGQQAVEIVGLNGKTAQLTNFIDIELEESQQTA
jgi:hypothetical protein